MITEKELICRSEILIILKIAKDKTRTLSKEQVIFLHYLLNNKSNIETNIDRLKRINFFGICDYDENINRLILLDFVLQDIKNEIFYYTITDKGIKFIEELNSDYLTNNIKHVETLFKSATNEKNLRETILPMVKI